jgi:anaerobic nitric oxide reductase transcription regulator
VNCAALSEALAESELFGHRRGAFTGAVADRPGKFEVADGGTLLLDEVGELSPPIQAKLLRALQNGEIQRVGADRPLRVDVRVIAATNRDLARAAAAGRFRADLYHRLAQYPLVVPPLRERGGDIPLLAGHLLSAASKRMGLPAVRLSAEARDALAAWPWPGNVRELENVLSRAALRRAAAAPAGAPVVLSAADLGPEFAAPAPQPRKICSEQFFRAPGATPAGTLREQVEEAKRAAIRRALAAAGGNQAAAARALGVHRGNLNRTARRLGLL